MQRPFKQRLAWCLQISIVWFRIAVKNQSTNDIPSLRITFFKVDFQGFRDTYFLDYFAISSTLLLMLLVPRVLAVLLLLSFNSVFQPGCNNHLYVADS